MVTKFTYTLETIIQAGKKHIPIGHFPISHQPGHAARRASSARRRSTCGGRSPPWCASTRSTSRSRSSSAWAALAVLAGVGVALRFAFDWFVGERPGAHPEPHPGGRAGDRGLPDHADRPGGRPDRQQPLADRGHAAARARARAAARAGRPTSSGCRPRMPARARRERHAPRDDGVPVRHVRSRPQRESPAAPRARRRRIRASGAARAALGGHATTRMRVLRARSLARPGAALGGRRAPAGAPPGGRRGGAPPLVVVGFGGQLDVLLAARVCRPRAALVFVPAGEPDRDTGRGPRACSRAGGVRARLVGGARSRDVSCRRSGARRHRRRTPPTSARSARRCDRVAVWHFGVEPEFVAAAGARRRRRGACCSTAATCRCTASRRSSRAAARLGIRADDRAHRRRSGAAAHGGAGGAPRRAASPGATRCRSTTLPGELAAAAVVLGVFGAGRKAAMVVPNKVYQAAAAGRPLVTRDGPALREVLEPGRALPRRARRATPPRWPPPSRRLLDDPALGGAPGRGGARACPGAVRRSAGGRASRRGACDAGSACGP